MLTVAFATVLQTQSVAGYKRRIVRSICEEEQGAARMVQAQRGERLAGMDCLEYGKKQPASTLGKARKAWCF